MHRCGRCRRVLRYDESLQIVQTAKEAGQGVVVTETLSCCSGCVSVLTGVPKGSGQTYPVGTPVLFPICGICRQALYQDDHPTAMRLNERDLDPDSEIEPGAYHACRDCVKKYAPRIASRLGYPEGTQLRGNQLL